MRTSLVYSASTQLWRDAIVMSTFQKMVNFGLIYWIHLSWDKMQERLNLGQKKRIEFYCCNFAPSNIFFRLNFHFVLMSDNIPDPAKLMRTILFTNGSQCASYDPGRRHIKTPSTLSNFWTQALSNENLSRFVDMYVMRQWHFVPFPVNLFRISWKWSQGEESFVKTFPLADSEIRGICGLRVWGKMTPHFTRGPFYDKIKLLAHF